MKTDIIKLPAALYETHCRIMQDIPSVMCQAYIGCLLFLETTGRSKVQISNPIKQETWGGLFGHIEESSLQPGGYLDSMPSLISQPETGKKINELLSLSENKNRHLLKRDGHKDIFSVIDYTLLGKEQLQTLIEDLKKIASYFTDPISTGKIYSDYIKLCDTSQTAGLNYIHLTELFSEILKDLQTSTLYDACGRNGYLLLTSRNSEDTILYAQEKDPYLRLVSKLNMFFNQVETYCIRNENALMRPLLKSNRLLLRFDATTCICPSSKKNELPSEDNVYHRFGQGIPPARHAGWAYLSHLVSVTRRGGTGVIAMPTSTFVSSGSCSRIRKNFLLEKFIETVIFLPEETTVVIFRPGHCFNETLLLNASAWSDVTFVGESYRQYRCHKNLPKEAVHRIMTMEEWENKNYTVHPANLFGNNTFSNVQEKNPDLLRKEISLLEAELSQIRSQLEREIGKLMK